jgi:hypothetical protein
MVPLTVPPLLEATARKKYFVLLASPLKDALNATLLVPEPRSCIAVELAPESVLLVPYWNQAFVSAPLGLTVPATDAPPLVTLDEAPVVTVGINAVVVKLLMAPLTVPSLLEATARKKYFVLLASPLKDALNATLLVPEPRSCIAVELAPESVLLVPYWNQVFVSAPLGLTVLATDAPALVTIDAAPVVTVGAAVTTKCQLLTRLFALTEPRPVVRS